MRKKFRSELFNLVALALVLSLAMPWSAFADDATADGDGLTPIATNALAFGNICANTIVTKSVFVAVSRSGASQQNTYKNGSSVTVSITGSTGSNFTGSIPSQDTILLPSNWESLANGSTSAHVIVSVSTTKAAAGSPLGGQITFKTSGTARNNSSLDKSTTLQVTGTVVSCDNDPPVLNIGPSNTVEATGAAGASVNFSATANDANPTHPQVTCKVNATAITSPYTFQLGSTTVNCSATDTAGNTATGSFTITVQDTTAPTITGMPNIPVTEATSLSGASVSYAQPTASDVVSGAVAVACKVGPTTITSPHTFPLGSTTVICSATDTAGRTANDSFTVNVVDTTKPVFSTTLGNITGEATSAAGAAVTFTKPTATDLGASVAVNCSELSGTTFPLGTTKVNCRADDGRGNSNDFSFDIVIVDTTAPDLDLEVAEATEATSGSGAAVYYSVSASDAVSNSLTASCNVPSGSTFELGETTITCAATDAAGNVGTESFVINVVDTTAPVIVVPTDRTVEAAGPDGAQVEYTATAEDVVDGTITPTCAPASGSVFALGTTPVECSATDDAGNSAADDFHITVVDTTAPAFTNVPGNQTLEATGPAGAAASYTAPTATDLVDGVRPVSCDVASGSTFPLGSTVVTCSASDTRDNTDSVSFSVTVVDTTAPTVTVPSNVTAEATSAAGAAVSYSGQSATDLVDSSLTVNCTPASGSTFALGSTTVTCSATDDAGNTGTASFGVTVADTTAPTLNLPADKLQAASSPTGAVVSYTATASDLVDSSITVSCNPASGSTFPIGITTVNCTATDAAGNSASGSFTVRVTYQLTGFFQPADPSPYAPTTVVWNTVKAGSTVPLKFEVFTGSSEVSSTSIVRQPLTLTKLGCSTGSEDAIEITASGNTALRYDTTNGGQFIYNWQTPKEAGSCYRVTVNILDGTPANIPSTSPNYVAGSSIVAYFKLK